jgi:2-amino-4-hydroxy-6-hydroxymethyldihydropteridine diphosphokinase
MISEPLAIGLGGNIGTEAEIVERFRRGREAISLLLNEPRSAPLYRTAPIGPDQAPFLNTALYIASPEMLSPEALIGTLLEIERLLGRDRNTETRNGPRPIDLDVLVWGARTLRSPELEIPHPRIAERRFALEPLVALVGEQFEIPGLGAIGLLLARVKTQAVEQLAETW